MDDNTLYNLTNSLPVPVIIQIIASFLFGKMTDASISMLRNANTKLAPSDCLYLQLVDALQELCVEYGWEFDCTAIEQTLEEKTAVFNGIKDNLEIKTFL